MQVQAGLAPTDVRELEAVFETNPDGLWLSDERGTTLRVNSAYERISGYPSAVVVGRPVQELVGEGKFRRSAVLEVLRRRRQVTLLNVAGTGRRFLVTGTPVFDPVGRLWRVLCNVRDTGEMARWQREAVRGPRALVDGRGEREPYDGPLSGSDAAEELIVAESSAMRRVLEMAGRAAACDLPVCLTGPSGVGKELVAERIHRRSRRRDRPLVRLNCAAIPDGLLEAELFGYERGAFTGALPTGKPGQFELADGGTLLLDEVADLPPAMQAKLLRVLQDLQVQRVGGRAPRRVDVRIVAAANRDLGALVRAGAFRADLYYRLRVLSIEIPPLAARRDDIAPLAAFYLDRCAGAYGRRLVLAPDALEALVHYDWPGNIRELRNEIERLAVMAPAERIGPADLAEEVRSAAPGETSRLAPVGAPDGPLPTLREAAGRAEARVIEEALRRHGSLRRAARALGVTHVTLLRKAREYGVRGAAAQDPAGTALNRRYETLP